MEEQENYDEVIEELNIFDMLQLKAEGRISPEDYEAFLDGNRWSDCY